MKGRLHRWMRVAIAFGSRRIPPRFRLVAGLALIVGGIFGFLPVLGFWMLPLGLIVVALGIPPARHRLRRRFRGRHPQATTARHRP
jgi:hypothetical protein